MKFRAGHRDAWEKKELPVMEGNPGVLIEDAASELRQMEWGDERTDTLGKEEYELTRNRDRH